MAKKVLLGLTGEIGSGKDTFCKYLQENVQDAHIFGFSQILSEILRIFFDAVKREDQQWLGSILREKFGKDILLKALIRKANNIDRGIIIFNGVRKQGEVQSIRDAGGKIVYVTADQKLRWARVKVRGEKADDDVSFDKFLEMHKAEAELQIPEIGAEADYKLENSGTKEEFYIQIKKVLESL